MQQAVRGFTLLELMIAIAIMGITLMIGIPSMQDTLKQSTVDNAILRISKDIIASRNHAINYETTVTVCPLVAENDSSACGDSDDWDNGYMIFLDGDGLVAGVSTYDETVDKKIIVRNDIGQNGKLHFPLDSLSYSMDGTFLNPPSSGIPYSFEFCPNMANPEAYSRAVIINLGGRPRPSSDQNNDGQDEIWIPGASSTSIPIDCA